MIPRMQKDKLRGYDPGVSSRIERTRSGRACAVVVTTPLPGIEVGYRYRVLGDELRRPGGFGFTASRPGGHRYPMRP
jgi:hypothetical protein